MMTANLSRAEQLKRLLSFEKRSIAGISLKVMNARILPISELSPPTLRTNSIMKFPRSECVKYSREVPSRKNVKRLFSFKNSKMPLGFSDTSTAASLVISRGFAPRV